MARFVMQVMLGVTALGAAIVFLSSGTMMGYSLLGFELGLGQRDFRIYNNFKDGTANNNRIPDADFGGHHGAPLALMKGVAEWGSLPMGQSCWGRGGSNYDALFVGLADEVGALDENIISARFDNGGSTLAITYFGKEGWQIRFFDHPWEWHDGPESPPEGNDRTDLQAICAHEYGHALGLGHTSIEGATMYPYASGVGDGLRTIETDDRDGLHAIYGAASASKPAISALSGGLGVGDLLVIDGYNFSVTDNEVWFTGDGIDGKPIKVLDVPSSSCGTTIEVVIPEGTCNGAVAVRKKGRCLASLSNSFPLQVNAGTGGVPVPDVRVNGEDGPLTVPTTEILTLTVSVDPGNMEGVEQDWWLYADFDPPWNPRYWYEHPGKWTQSPRTTRAYDGPLSLLEDLVIFSFPLPRGFWRFTFAIDEKNDIIELTRMDMIEITVN